MALNIKDEETERLAALTARLAGENKTQAIRQALRERLARLQLGTSEGHRPARLRAVLETEIWPLIPQEQRGRRLTRDEEDDLLGYGPEGV
jgi:antitoxin VapB